METNLNEWSFNVIGRPPLVNINSISSAGQIRLIANNCAVQNTLFIKCPFSTSANKVSPLTPFFAFFFSRDMSSNRIAALPERLFLKQSQLYTLYVIVYEREDTLGGIYLRTYFLDHQPSSCIKS